MKVSITIRINKDLCDYIQTRAKEQKITISTFISELIISKIYTSREKIYLEGQKLIKMSQQTNIKEKDILECVKEIFNNLEKIN